MRYQLILMRRLSHKYVTGWAGEDDWEHIGGWSILNSAVSNEAWDRFYWSHTIRVDSKADADTIRNALLDTMQGGCRCEHDCCGHWQTSAHKAIHVKGKEWRVLGSSYRNV